MHTSHGTGILYKLPLACILLWAAVVQLSGCTYLFATATEPLADGLSSAILDQNDPETVRQGAPAYLLMVDGLIAKNPGNERLLRSGANLYAAYATIFVEDPERARRMTDRAWEYGKRALCSRRRTACNMDLLTYEPFVAALSQMDKPVVPALYTYGVAWAGRIETHQDDWNEIANIPKVEAIMERVVELDERYEQGGAHVYLGMLATLLPPALGGRPEEARAHLERALELSQGRNLMVKVIMAEHYARPLFDRTLHDRLLNEALSATAEQPGFTLMNILAKEKARGLLDSADEYF